MKQYLGVICYYNASYATKAVVLQDTEGINCGCIFVLLCLASMFQEDIFSFLTHELKRANIK